MSTVQLLGAILVHGARHDHVFLDSQMMGVDPTRRLIYGIDWIYHDGKEFKDSVIVITWNNERSHTTFLGRYGLPDALKFAAELKRKGF